MGRPRTRANQNPQEPDLANVVATLQRQLMEQQRETDRLREQIARLNQIPQANVVLPQKNPIPPVVPQVSKVHHEIPQNAEVPIAPVGVQANPPLIREDLLYEHFRRMKALEFKRPTDLIEADNWLIDIQMTVQMRRNVETMSCRAIRAEYWINKDKEARAQIFKAKKEEKAVVKQSQPRQNQELYLRNHSGNAGRNPRQFGKNKRKANVTSQGQQMNYPQKKINRDQACYLCGKEDHYARNCTLNNQNLNPQFPNRNSGNQLHAVQVKIEDPTIVQGRL
ncbi:hypothetical protein TIFTF001_029191 [Ficus carica]|uniref:CCHC-type domain-containing protein n=1 Tax=Ficus carica TaxID=3494 RepID=A0AA88DRC4_FICCA|nr:hypothetical protein TIFTF001_029191 [Ficus carica]